MPIDGNLDNDDVEFNIESGRIGLGCQVSGASSGRA